MSEKGQDEGSAEGSGTGTATGVGVDGTPRAGGSQADQSGPSPTETRTGWDDATARAALENALGPESVLDSIDTSDLGKPDIPPMPDDPNHPPTEPEFPAGGPTDTRSG